MAGSLRHSRPDIAYNREAIRGEDCQPARCTTATPVRPWASIPLQAIPGDLLSTRCEESKHHCLPSSDGWPGGAIQSHTCGYAGKEDKLRWQRMNLYNRCDIAAASLPPSPLAEPRGMYVCMCYISMILNVFGSV